MNRKISKLIFLSTAIIVSALFVNVNNVLAAATTCAMTATPSNITAGGSSTISWTATNAFFASISPTIGLVSSINGDRPVSPAITTTYTLTVTGIGGTNTCSTTVVVNPLTCPYYEGQDGGYLVSFSTNKKIYSNSGLDKAQISIDRSIPKGDYLIKLFALDSYSSRTTADQPNESYYIKFVDSGGNVLQTSNKTPDLQDRVETAFWEGIVNNNLSVSEGVTKIIAWHSVYPDTTSANSLIPACALFVPISNPVPSCTLTANPTSIAPGDTSTLT